MTWSNKFLKLYQMLPDDLKQENISKKKSKRRISKWIKETVDIFVT